MKILHYIVLLFTVSLTIVSCSSKKEVKEKSLLESVAGNWDLAKETYDDGNYVPYDTAAYFLNFDKTQNTFAFNIGADLSDTTKGTWTLNVKDSLLELIPYADQFRVTFDSTVIEIDSSSKKLLYFSGGTHVATQANDSLIQEIALINFQTNFTESGNMQLITEGVTYEFRVSQISAGDDELGTYSFISIVRGLIGMVFLIFVAWLFSANRKGIDWALVGKGIALQLIIALLVLKVPFVQGVFDGISKGFVTLIGYTDWGINFLFGQFGPDVIQAPLITFAFKVLPTIIFFSALVSLFYYWGILQKIVYVFAWIMKKFMRLSGAESLAAAGNVFLGQTEAPLLVKPYLLGMTKSEIMCLMTGGMATIAGGVLAAYVGFLGGDDPVQQAFFAKHLLIASIISAPAAIIAAKILIPETEKINEDLTISKEKIGTNALEAISNGTTDGLKLAVNVGAMLIVFISIMALGNGVLSWVGAKTGLNEQIASYGVYKELSFEFILGYLGKPIVWLIGVDWVDTTYVGELLGTKTVVNEFIGYKRLGEMQNAGMLNHKSMVISTYMLCGFANFASIGIQIGGIGALVPSRKGLLSKLGMRALVGGTVACLMTAAIAGMLE